VLDYRNAEKRRAQIVALTAELELCIPDPGAENLHDDTLGVLLNRFLESLPAESRVIFLRRYWFAESVEAIARRYGFSISKVKTRLHRTRQQLRQFLESEGVRV